MGLDCLNILCMEIDKTYYNYRVSSNKNTSFDYDTSDMFAYYPMV